jgi:hypothetical protein
MACRQMGGSRERLLLLHWLCRGAAVQRAAGKLAPNHYNEIAARKSCSCKAVAGIASATAGARCRLSSPGGLAQELLRLGERVFAG